jgi:hypothetical protein
LTLFPYTTLLRSAYAQSPYFDRNLTLEFWTGVAVSTQLALLAVWMGFGSQRPEVRFYGFAAGAVALGWGVYGAAGPSMRFSAYQFVVALCLAAIYTLLRERGWQPRWLGDAPESASDRAGSVEGSASVVGQERSPRYQFSILQLLVLMTVVGVGLAVLRVFQSTEARDWFVVMVLAPAVTVGLQLGLTWAALRARRTVRASALMLLAALLSGAVVAVAGYGLLTTMLGLLLTAILTLVSLQVVRSSGFRLQRPAP